MHLGLGSQNKILENANGKVMFNYQSSQNISKIFNCTFPTSEKIILGEIIFLIFQDIFGGPPCTGFWPDFWHAPFLRWCRSRVQLYVHTLGQKWNFCSKFHFLSKLEIFEFLPKKFQIFDSRIAKIQIQVLNKKLSFAPVCNYSLCDRTFLALIFPLRNVFSCCCHPACLLPNMLS